MYHDTNPQTPLYLFLQLTLDQLVQFRTMKNMFSAIVDSKFLLSSKYTDSVEDFATFSHLLSKSFISGEGAPSNYLPIKPQMFPTMKLLLQHTRLISPGRSSGQSLKFTRRGTHKPLPLGCPKSNSGDHAVKSLFILWIFV